MSISAGRVTKEPPPAKAFCVPAQNAARRRISSIRGVALWFARQTYHDTDARPISPALPAERTDLVNSACGADPHQCADLQQYMPDRATGHLSEVGNTTAAPARGRTQRS